MSSDSPPGRPPSHPKSDVGEPSSKSSTSGIIPEGSEVIDLDTMEISPTYYEVQDSVVPKTEAREPSPIIKTEEQDVIIVNDIGTNEIIDLVSDDEGASAQTPKHSTGNTPEKTPESLLASQNSTSAPSAPRKLDISKLLRQTAKDRAQEQKDKAGRLQALNKAAKALQERTIVNPPANQPAKSPPGNKDEDENAWMNKLPTPEDDIVAAAFKESKAKYDRKVKAGKNDINDDIEFRRLDNAEKLRIKRLRQKQALEEQVNQAEVNSDEENDLFLPQEPPSAKRPLAASDAGGDDEGPPAPKRPRKKKNRIPAQDLRDSMKIGLDVELAKDKKKASKKARKSSGKSSKDAKNKADKSKKWGRGKGRPKKRPNLSNLQSLTTANAIADAQGNASRSGIPTFSAKDKSKALQQLIASIPIEERGTTTSDKAAVIEATKKFSGLARSDGAGGWKIKGMKSALYHHQLLGTAFMRDRENGRDKPLGGMQADEMGFGKTVMMLANILDGAAAPDDKCKTTLIVATPTLVTQWMNEMNKHCERGALGPIIQYRSGSRILSNDPVEDLQMYHVILTTYGEVMKSYPSPKPPMHLVTEEQKNAWWKNHYEQNVGVLHKIYFRRIVLDEAQAIKNRDSKTSIAVRGLSSKFRWAISGTPVQNYIEEFFPFFSFLRAPHTGTYDTFVHNYCSRDEISSERLYYQLSKIMLRRTHVDTLFGLPLLKLPDIGQRTIEVEFNEVERAIYKIVRTKFINQLNHYSRDGTLDTHYRAILVMMLKLRQLSGHILMIQSTIKEIVDAEDVEALWRLTANEVTAEDKPNTTALLELRRLLSKKKSDTPKDGNDGAPSTPASGEGSNPNISQDVDTGNAYGLHFKFRKFLRSLRESGQWAEIYQRSTCHKCRSIPDDPHVTSCFHLYCKECLMSMSFEAAKKENDRVACLECGNVFDSTSPCAGLEELGFGLTPPSKEQKKARKGQKGASRTSSRDTPEDDDDKHDVDWIELGAKTLPSAKTIAAKACILNWFKESPNSKIIVYSQFLDMIRILGKMLQGEGWEYVTFTGKMTFDARATAIKSFTDDTNTRIMLCSLKAGGIGLNLTMASKVILMDLWWNESVESQAFCRVFRLGQTQKTEIVRILVKDTIDGDLLAMQNRKNEDIDRAMGPKHVEKRASVNTLLKLFGPVKEDDNGTEFILVEDEDNPEDSDVEMMTDKLPPRPF